jgi:hypothetical protein
VSAIAVATGLGLHGSLAAAASSASFQIPNGSLDVAGGKSTSSSFALTACVGSEIAGSSASSSFRIDSGCGSALEVAKPGPASGGTAAAQPVPGLSPTAALLLAALLCALAWRQFRGRASPPPRQ